MKIGTKLTLSAIGLCSVLIGSLSYLSYTKMRQLEDIAEKRELKVQHRIILEHILDESKKAEAFSALLANMPLIQEAFAKRDRETLLERLHPFFKKMEQRYHVNTLHFHTVGTVEKGVTKGQHSDAISFLRVHKPQQYGDDISGYRKMVVVTNTTKQPQSGFEKGRYQLAIRGVVPIFYQKQHVGSVEFGINCDKDFLKAISGVDVALYVSSKEATETLPKGGNDQIPPIPPSLKGENDEILAASPLSQTENFQIMAENVNFSTFVRTFEIPSDRVEQQLYLFNNEALTEMLVTEGGSIAYKVLNGKPVVIYSEALKDFSDQKMGILSIIADRTPYLTAMNETKILLFVIAFVSLLVVSIIFLLIGKMIERPICQIAKAMKSIAKGHLDISIQSTGRKDEIGVMQRAAVEMSETMKCVIGDIQNTVTAAKRGDLTQRVDTQFLKGFMQALGENTNQLVTTTSHVMEDITCVMTALAEGCLTEQLKNHYEGIYAEVSTLTQITTENLQKVIYEIQAVVANASRGELDKLVNLSNKQGFGKDLSQAVNALVIIQKNFSHDIGVLLENLKNGDLTQPIQTQYAGEFNRIKQNANSTIEKLISTLSQIQQIAEVVNHAATEMEIGNNALSSRTEEQAASLEKTARNMEQMTATVERNANNAQTANQLAISATEVAEDAGMVVKDAVETMQLIREGTGKISSITHFINSIAFQTNILALNAAIEAAHAGEHGRGFAVVATEVRNLAQRTAESAKEINALIEESVSNAEIGTMLVEQAGDGMHEIIAHIGRVTDNISEISTAIIEQSEGIKQINTAIAQMDNMTQQNAALVEKAATHAEGLAQQAAKLTDAFGQFKFN